MGIASDIKAFREKALKAASDNTNNVFRDSGKLVIRFSPSPSNPGPYATGLLVNQWMFSIGMPDLSVGTATSPTGADSISRLDAFLATNPWLGKDATAYITNSTEEAIYADLLDWKKGQGTNGWIWSGRAGAYQMRAQTIIYIQQAYS